jgi:hypothetical protein
VVDPTCHQACRPGTSWTLIALTPLVGVVLETTSPCAGRSDGPEHARLEPLTMSLHVEPVSSERSGLGAPNSLEKIYELAQALRFGLRGRSGSVGGHSISSGGLVGWATIHFSKSLSKK